MLNVLSCSTQGQAPTSSGFQLWVGLGRVVNSKLSRRVKASREVNKFLSFNEYPRVLIGACTLTGLLNVARSCI